MATTVKVNADDQHLEDLTEIGSRFDVYLRALLDGEPRSEWTLLEAQPPELPGSAAATSGANAPAP